MMAEVLYTDKAGRDVLNFTLLPVRPFSETDPQQYVVVEEYADGSVHILSYPEGNLLMQADAALAVRQRMKAEGAE